MVSVAESVGFGAAGRRIGPTNDEVNALPGDPLWRLRISPRPRTNCPQRARVFFSGGWATFDDPVDATHYLTGHSVSVEEAAHRYIAWAVDGIDPTHTTNAMEQV